MKFVRNTFLLSVLMSAAISCTSQDTKKGEEDKDQENDPAREKATVWINQNHSGASGLKYETDDNGYLEVQFESDGEKYRADFNHDSGEWIETEQSVDWDELPEVVQNAIEEEFDKDDIAELELVNNKEKGRFYDVEFKDKGKNQDVMFREDGSRD